MNYKPDTNNKVIHLISYANDENGRRGSLYEMTQTKMVLFFKKYFQQILYFHIFNSKNTNYKESDFYKNNPKIFDSKQILTGNPKRQNGLYNYAQIYLVLDILKNKVKNNEFLLWHDVNPREWNQFFNKKHKQYFLDNHIDKCIKNKGIIMWSNKNRNGGKEWTSPSLLNDLNGKESFLTDSYFCCSWFLIQKTDFTLNLLDKILNYAISDNYLKARRPNDYQDSSQDLYNIFMKNEGMCDYVKGENKIILSTF